MLAPLHAKVHHRFQSSTAGGLGDAESLYLVQGYTVVAVVPCEDELIAALGQTPEARRATIQTISG